MAVNQQPRALVVLARGQVVVCWDSSGFDPLLSSTLSGVFRRGSFALVPYFTIRPSISGLRGKYIGLAIPMVYFAAASGGWFGVSLVRGMRRKARMAAIGHACAECEYPLETDMNRCPECGLSVDT
jgi:hypothetical protein